MTLGEAPHVIDEWQLVPRIWDAVRRSVDKGRRVRGGWILTGFLDAAVARTRGGDAPSHSGAGRIGRIRMHPMSLVESGDSHRRDLARGPLSRGVRAVRRTVRHARARRARLSRGLARGGWGMDVSSAQTLARRSTCASSSPRALRPQAGTVRPPRGWLRSLARNLGQATTYKTIVRDMYGDEEDPRSLISEETVASYLALLKAS